MSVWTLQRILLQRLFRYAFAMGRSSKGSGTDFTPEEIDQKCNEWIENNIVN